MMIYLNRVMCFIFSLLLMQPALSNENEGDEESYLYNFFKLPVEGMKEVVTLEQQKLLRNTAILSVTALAYWQDKNIRNYWRENIKSDDTDYISAGLYEVGTPKGMLVFQAATVFTGLVFDNQYLIQSTALSLQSAFVSQVFAESAKELGGRKRPHQSGGDHQRWREGGQSFFSGHASGAFAVLTVFADRYRENPWIYWGSYGMAAAVGASRINDDGHWASDVLLGAFVGIGVGKLTLKHSPFKNSEQVVIIPIPEREGLSLTLIYPF